MTLVVYGAVYAGTIVFLVACVVRAVRYARLPVHLRWELYPVPHEEPARVRHGGSYFEDPQWWTRKRRFNLAGDLRFMIPEMVFLKGLWEWNRRLWYRSFAFHFGLYLLAGAVCLLVAAALVTIARPVAADGEVVAAMRALYRVAGVSGSVLAFCGALGLLHRRLTDPALRIYSAPADVANPAFFAITIGLVAVGYVAAGAGSPGALGFTRGLLRLDASVPVRGALAAGLVLASALLAYIPLTHMSHFIAKYFTYHAVRWDDRPVIAGRRLEHHIAACLAMRPTWTAKHLGADGTRTWLDIALADPAGEAKK
jgi:nitrate reductase gamma subunit